MKIYLVRHGETTGDIEDKYGGDYEDNLTERGQQQSRQLVEKLKNKGIEIIYHSPRIRATQTAQIVAEKLRVKTEVINDIRERNAYGILTGLTKAEALEKYPDKVAELKKNKLYHNVIGSEKYEHFKKRVIKALDEITSNDQYSTIAIITHGGPVTCIVREVLKLGELEKLSDCAILEIEKTEGLYKLIKTDGVKFEE